ncbi:MAG: type I-B CRISPR-associated protein Cas7/Cst2/DevR [Candidatus Pacearchaeota archaeon]
MSDGNNKNNGRRYIVMDIVFYGSSLNYDQGAGNYQELKKITKWDGKQYILVSRYALRYSILHWANKLFPNEWKLASGGKNGVLIAEEGGVARLKTPEEAGKEDKEKEYFTKIFENYPEFDLFGFMIAPKKQGEQGPKKQGEQGPKKQGEQGISITRTSPVKISHAISLTPYTYDSHFTANLDLMRRASSGPGAGSNPVNVEEKKDFYVYNVVIDVDRIGKYTKEERGNDNIGDIDVTDDKRNNRRNNRRNDRRNNRIIQLIETIFNLKREIKGRMEDLSPWLVICGLYNDGKYETYLDKIELAKSHVYKVIIKEKETKDKEGRIIKEIEHETVEKDAPKFKIDIDSNLPKEATKEQIIKKIREFLGNSSNKKSNTSSENKPQYPMILVYKRQFIQTEPTFQILKT